MCGYRSKRLGTTSHSARRLVRVFMITHVKQRRAKIREVGFDADDAGVDADGYRFEEAKGVPKRDGSI